MLLSNVFTLNINNERLTRELSYPTRDLTKLQVALGAYYPESGLVIGPGCWPRADDLNTLLLTPPGASSERSNLL